MTVTNVDERWSDESVSRFDALEVWQRRAGEWTDSRFPDDDLSQRGLVLGEETGEVLRCILKAKQDIRGGTDKWLAELPSEVADAFFCLVALAHRAGFDLGRAIEDRWEELRQRTYAAPQTPSRTDSSGHRPQDTLSVSRAGGSAPGLATTGAQTQSCSQCGQKTPVCAECGDSIIFVPKSGFGNQGEWRHKAPPLVDVGPHLPHPKVFKW